MRAVLYAAFALGALLGIPLGAVLFFVALARGKRAVHADGLLVRAEVIARDEVVGPRLAGPALARLSGAFAGATGGRDILGLALRLQRAATDDPRTGDQDLVFGTFESFGTAAVDRAQTDASDYAANAYHSVTPWWTPGLGAVCYHLAPPSPAAPDRGADRRARLIADLAADRARWTVLAGREPVADLRLSALLDSSRDAAALRVSLFRCGRGLRPVGLRNGIRATVYPIAQLARRVRGG